MPSLNIPDEMFERLAKRAAALNVTVEQLIAPLLDHEVAADRNSHAATPLTPPAFADWKRGFDAWMAVVQARADRFPPGFVMDDSRESIYKGCGQ